MQYRKARLDEVQEVAQVCADAFEDYPYLSMIASNLKKPEQYKEFVLALQEMLVRLAIKRWTHVWWLKRMVALLRQLFYSIRRFLCLTISRTERPSFSVL